jgi:hypothetical protein
LDIATELSTNARIEFGIGSELQWRVGLIEPER